MKSQSSKRDASLEVVDEVRAPRAAQPFRGPQVEDDEPTLRDYLETILDARRLVLSVIGVSLLAGLAYYLLATPKYRSDALMQVEDKKATIAGMDDLSNLFSAASPAETEIEILRARSLVGGVVDELQLDVLAQPRFFPIVGRGIARRRGRDGVASPLLGLSSFAWGGERIDIDRIDVPQDWIGQKLTVVARGGGRFDLLDPDGSPLGSGEVGKAFQAHDLTLFVSKLVAHDGTRFRVARLSRTKVIGQLQDALVIAEKGKKTGIIKMTLDGESPARVAAILDTLSRLYVRQNVERKSAEAGKTLDFVKTQLPQLKSSVDAAEHALKEYRSKRGGGIDLSVETKAALDRIADIEKMLVEIQLQRSEVRQRFTPTHPAWLALEQKAQQLQNERDGLNQQIRSLPETELKAASLMRDAKVAGELYVLLLNKAQELQIMKYGAVGNVRVVDAAVLPEEPASPKAALTLALSLLVGIALGTGAAFARKALSQGVEDPEVIERETGLPVYATVPHSEAQTGFSQTAPKKGAATPLLAHAQPSDLSIEALRSLRTSLQFALADAENNVIAIGGPSPGIGKSFVSANLAYVLAENGTRVLLVDADLRKGRLHHYFGGSRGPGLSDLIRGEASDGEVIRPTQQPNLRFLPTGHNPPNPSELLSSSRFQEIVARASREYDLVLVDTAPILAVTDAAIAARVAGLNLMVLKAGQHPMREIGLAVKRLAQGGVEARALILNNVMPKAGGYSKYGYHYHYDYKAGE